MEKRYCKTNVISPAFMEALINNKDVTPKFWKVSDVAGCNIYLCLLISGVPTVATDKSSFKTPFFFCHGHQDWGMGKKKMDGGPCCRLMYNWLKNKSYWSYQGKCLLVKGREEKKQGEGKKKSVYLPLDSTYQATKTTKNFIWTS